MKVKALSVCAVAVVAGAVVIPAFARQTHSVIVNETIGHQGISGTAEVTMYVTHQDGHAGTSAYRIEISAHDLEDARSRFLHDHLVDGIYQFVEKQGDGDHMYLIERTQVVQTRIRMK